MDLFHVKNGQTEIKVDNRRMEEEIITGNRCWSGQHFEDHITLREEC